MTGSHVYVGRSGDLFSRQSKHFGDEYPLCVGMMCVGIAEREKSRDDEP